MIFPFVFSAYGRRPPSRNYSTRNLLGRVRLEIQTLRFLPSPTYAIVDAIDDRRIATWYEIDGRLVRAVMLDGQPATVQEIAETTALVSHPRQRWFHDHPLAVFRGPKKRAGAGYYKVDVPGEPFAISRSDHDERLAAAFRVYAECFEHDGTMLAPAAPPTWRVVVWRTHTAMELVWSRCTPRQLPSFHFAIGRYDVALQFAKTISGPNSVMIDEVGWRDSEMPGSPSDGALATAKAFAPRLLWHFSSFRRSRLTADQIGVLASLRDLYERFGTDEEADVALDQLSNTAWPQLDERSQALIRMLSVRKRLLVEHDSPPELDNFRLGD